MVLLGVCKVSFLWVVVPKGQGRLQVLSANGIRVQTSSFTGDCVVWTMGWGDYTFAMGGVRWEYTPLCVIPSVMCFVCTPFSKILTPSLVLILWLICLMTEVVPGFERGWEQPIPKFMKQTHRNRLNQQFLPIICYIHMQWHDVKIDLIVFWGGMDMD